MFWGIKDFGVLGQRGGSWKEVYGVTSPQGHPRLEV